MGGSGSKDAVELPKESPEEAAKRAAEEAAKRQLGSPIIQQPVEKLGGGRLRRKKGARKTRRKRKSIRSVRR